MDNRQERDGVNMADQLDDSESSQQVLHEASIVTQAVCVFEKIKAANNGAKYKIQKAEMGVCLSVLPNNGGMFASNEEGQSQLAPLPLQIQYDQDPIVIDHSEVDTGEVEDQRQDPEQEHEVHNEEGQS